jgi:hypothetical protein
MKLYATILSTRIAIAALTFALGIGPASVQAQTRQHIQRASLDAMFSAMRAKAPWNVDGPLLWGYFFFDPSREKLERAAAELMAKGYRIVGIEPTPSGLFRLHAEKIETHTPASLDARNQAFYALAERLGIDYDGMDVGPVLAVGGQ